MITTWNSKWKHFRWSSGPDTDDLDVNGFLKCRQGFHGVSSIKDDQEMLDWAGVTLRTFSLLRKIYDVSDGTKITADNRLLIFACKMKLGQTYSALGVLFSVNRRTISTIFISRLEYLVVSCQHFIACSIKEVILSTMPEEFKSTCYNCRVIIDCTEIKIDQTSDVKEKVQSYSHYKKVFTIKVLIGCTPTGYIALVSNCYGSWISDT